MNQAPPPGWYADPHGTGRRWWDGTRWTEHVQAQPAIAARADAKTWAMVAHLSALAGAVVALAFLGPLVVYLIKRDDDPFVRQQAAEALNFNLSWLIYTIVGGILLVIGIVLLVGIVLIPLAIAAGIAWLVLVIVAAVKAGKGEPYRYPLTIRFVD